MCTCRRCCKLLTEFRATVCNSAPPFGTLVEQLRKLCAGDEPKEEKTAHQILTRMNQVLSSSTVYFSILVILIKFQPSSKLSSLLSVLTHYDNETLPFSELQAFVSVSLILVKACDLLNLDFCLQRREFTKRPYNSQAESFYFIEGRESRIPHERKGKRKRERG